jgi:MFS family permease
MTPVLAAGFNEVAETFDIALSRVSLTTGLYMMGLGVGCVIMSPTAIQFGKRPVYLASCILFILSSVWCALSPNFASLIVARIFQGIAVSPVECLPSATIAEIFFLHERAYRLGIYTLLLLGGKNLIPLVSAAIIQSLGWRWVFWMVAIILGFGGVLLFFFVPETFWDRTPHARAKHTHDSLSKMHLPQLFHRTTSNFSGRQQQPADGAGDPSTSQMQLRLPLGKRKDHHVAFKPAPKDESQSADASTSIGGTLTPDRTGLPKLTIPMSGSGFSTPKTQSKVGTPLSSWTSPADWDIVDDAQPTLGPTPDLHNLNSPWYQGKANDDTDYFAMTAEPESSAPTATAQVSTQQEPQPASSASAPTSQSAVLKLPNTQLKSKSGDKHAGLTTNHERKAVPTPSSRTTSPTRSDDIKGLKKDDSEPGSDLLPVQTPVHFIDNEPLSSTDPDGHSLQAGAKYTEHYRAAPPKNYKDFLKPYHGRLSHDNWFRIAARPFILYLYPSILWASMVYALSVGWLIVLSESVSLVYKNRNTYNFDSIQTGLVYLSPFIGGVLGTAVAGRVSDVIVRFMARRNDGVYEPEFRLVMAIPIAITSVIGLMGFGWSAHERDNWFVPTFFFGVISFGCSLGSTTAITFAVDSYRQYAGEALVTLNFTKSKSYSPSLSHRIRN